MKKYIFMAVAGMLALSSCSNDNDELNEKNAPRQMTFTAGFGDDGAQRRATLTPSTKKVSFDAGDQISILSEKNTNTAFTTSEGGSTATFTGTAVDDTKFYAVYPYQSGLTVNSSTGVISGVTIPYIQSGAAKSACGWDPSAPIAYATTTDGSLTFHNACALLKIINGAGNGSITVQAPGRKISRIFDLDTSTGELTYVSGDYEDRVFVGDVPKDKTIYIAIAPVTTDAFLANWNDARQKEKNTKITFTFEAGKIYDLGNTSEWPESSPWR